DSGFELTGFSDADYAGCKDSFKSTSGGAQFLGEKLVSWSSKKQDCTALSTAEAEYVSLSTCCAQVLWMRKQLTDYGFHFDKIPIYCDSKSAIAISCNPVQHSRTKHIAVRYHFIKEHVEKARAGGIYPGTLPLDRVEVLGGSPLQPPSTKYQMCTSYYIICIHSDEWKSFQSQHQTALRIRRWRYNLIPAESKFKKPMPDHQDKFMMKAQHTLRGGLLASFRDLEHEGGDTKESQGGIKDNDSKIKIQDHRRENNDSKKFPRTRL
nr:retrovirus-related Pol polyprotein from transposon TNT 1-94 [Tanacetum cinerariifolium]